MLRPASDRLELLVSKDNQLTITATIHSPIAAANKYSSSINVINEDSLDHVFGQTANSGENQQSTKETSKNTRKQSNDTSNLSTKSLQFSSKTGQFEVDTQPLDQYSPTLGHHEKEIRIWGLVGYLDLEFGKYLFYISERQLVAECGDKRIYRVQCASYHTVYRNAYLSLSEEQMERESLEAILGLLQSGHFYFAYDYDVTNNTKRFLERYECDTSTTNDTALGNSVFRWADERFWWNKFLLKPLLNNSKCTEFILPLICGYVGHFSRKMLRPQSTENKNVDFLLISRLHKSRVGTRFNRRGLDRLGNAAIFVETEMIARTNETVASFVMTRGSVPWLWEQPAIDLQYRPPITIQVM